MEAKRKSIGNIPLQAYPHDSDMQQKKKKEDRKHKFGLGMTFCFLVILLLLVWAIESRLNFEIHDFMLLYRKYVNDKQRKGTFEYLSLIRVINQP